MIATKQNAAAGLIPYDFSGLDDIEGVLDTFFDSLKQGDPEAAHDMLCAGLRHMNKSQLSKRHAIARRTLYNLLQGKSWPSLALVAKICEILAEAAKAQKKAKAAA